MWFRNRLAQRTSGSAIAPEASSRSRPSVAVLPFANMSGDPEQEFFADGLTEEILTELSRFRSLLVISRNSTFKYKSQRIDIREVSRDLGADYVVEGSVRKTADRVRVIVQLIDGRTDQHIWADRYDRKLTDIFEIQDEITTAIVATLPGRIEAATRAPTESLPSRIRKTPMINMTSVVTCCAVFEIVSAIDAQK